MRLKLAHELLDEDEGTPAEIARSLDELWWINQHLGGLRTWRRLLDVFFTALPSPPPRLSLLDLGAGTGQMAAALADELARRGVQVEAVAVDRRAAHLRPSPAFHAVAADAYHLPFADQSVDLVTCNLFLHHFHDAPGDPQASRLLAEMARVARRAVLINDLDRAWAAYAAIQILGLRFSRITRHDGPRSVRQAYTRRELEALASAASPARVLAHRLFPYRLGLILMMGAGPSPVSGQGDHAEL